jgi:hypothetical protein
MWKRGDGIRRSLQGQGTVLGMGMAYKNTWRKDKYIVIFLEFLRESVTIPFRPDFSGLQVVPRGGRGHVGSK